MFKIFAAEGPLGGAPTPLGLAFARAAAKKSIISAPSNCEQRDITSLITYIGKNIILI